MAAPSSDVLPPRKPLVQSLLEPVDLFDLLQREGGDPIGGFAEVPAVIQLYAPQRLFGLLFALLGGLLSLGKVVDLLLQLGDSFRQVGDLAAPTMVSTASA